MQRTSSHIKNLLHRPFIIITSSHYAAKHVMKVKVNEINNFELGTLDAILMQFKVFVEVRHFLYRLHPNSYMNLVQFWMLEQCVSLQKLAPQMIFWLPIWGVIRLWQCFCSEFDTVELNAQLWAMFDHVRRIKGKSESS